MFKHIYMIIFTLDGRSSRVFTAPPTTSDDVSESRRAVPFHRGIFQPLPPATLFQGVGEGEGVEVKIKIGIQHKKSLHDVKWPHILSQLT